MEKGNKKETNVATSMLRAMRTSIIEEGFFCVSWMVQMDSKDPKDNKKWFNQCLGIMDKISVQFEKHLDKKDEKEFRVCTIRGLKDCPELFGSQKILDELDKMLQCNKEDDREGMISAFQRFKEMKENMRNMVVRYFDLAEQAKRLENAKNKGKAGSSRTEQAKRLENAKNKGKAGSSRTAKGSKK